MEAAVEQTTTTTTAGGGVDGDHAAPKADITNISKGKRTKRQRPQSPILFTFSSTNVNNDINDNSPVSSSGFPAGSTTTEDEDTAESLILLSRGQSLDLSSAKSKDDFDGMYKFNSKRYIHTSTTGNTGVYVYECRTCNRTFPSFQALGGHRASHKKPKNNEEMRKPPPYTDKNESPTEFPFRNHNSFVFLQLNNRVSMMGSTTKSSSSKLHECSICGTEFNSGQALGGHMRRHRVAGGGNKGGNHGTTNTNTTTLSLIPFSPINAAETYDNKSKNNALCLDLNLPAPREATAAAAADDDGRQKRGFTFSPTEENENNQLPAVRLPAAPTLVDCQY